MRRLIAALMVILFAGPVFAGESHPLTEDQVKRFIAAIDDVQAFGDEMEKTGRNILSDTDTAPAMGEAYHPYGKALAALKEKAPADYAKLSGIVRRHGFKEAESWGETGDKVIVAYLAEKAAKENPDYMKQMEAMDPSMLDKMPPEMKAQMAAAMAMMQAVKSAPAADRATVRPFLDELEAGFGGDGAGR